MLWPVSWEKEACMTTWCAYLHLSLTPTPFQLFLSPLAITLSMWQLHWRSSSTGSWTGASHGGNHLEAGNLPCSKNQNNTTWVNFLLDVPHQSKEIQPRDTSLLKILFPYLTAGWLGPSLWQEFCSKRCCTGYSVNQDSLEKHKKEKNNSRKIRNHRRLPKTLGFSQEHVPLMTAGVDFTRLAVMTSKIYDSFYNKTTSSKEWCSDNIYLSGFSFFGHINLLLYFKNSHSCLLNLE